MELRGVASVIQISPGRADQIGNAVDAIAARLPSKLPLLGDCGCAKRKAKAVKTVHKGLDAITKAGP